MKKLIITSIFAVLAATMTTVMAQDRPEEYLGLPGDNLNLYAVMNLFQESETIEGFERNLNDENSRINNLDLNRDNQVDYIMVMDYVDGDVHTIVLRAAINKDDYQDVAVFTVQQYQNGTVRIQLVGDEALYGKNYIIEPQYAVNGETPNPGYNGNHNVTVVTTDYYDIGAWPVIRFMYRPNYVIWHSRWYWGYYPDYWHSWNPWYWDYYYGYHSNWYPTYYRYYHHSHNHFYTRYDDFYYNNVRSRSQHVYDGIREGHYQPTYSHPEQRREGAALYSRTYPDRNAGAHTEGSMNSQGRRTVSESTRAQAPEGSNGTVYRRSAGTSTGRTEVHNTSGQGSDVSRRATTTVSDRSGSTSSNGRSTEVTRRTTTTVSDRSDSRPESGQTSTATHRSTTTVSEKPASRSESVKSSAATHRSTTSASEKPAQRSEAPRASSSSRSSSQRVSSSSGRSSSQSRTNTSTERKSSSAKESTDKKSSRR